MTHKVETHGGTFQALPVRKRGYQVRREASATNAEVRGCYMEMIFRPNELVEAPKIGLTQTITAKEDGKASFDFGVEERAREERRGRANTAGQGDEGRHVDANAGDTNPIYGKKNSTGRGTRLGDGEPQGARGLPTAEWGRRVRLPGGSFDSRDAYLSDKPAMYWRPGQTISERFETTALVVEGPMSGTYLGSVLWGHKTSTTGKTELEPFALGSLGTPSREFMAAAGNWNAQEIVSGGSAALDTPVGGKVVSLGSVEEGGRYKAGTLIATIGPTGGPTHEIRCPSAVIIDTLHVRVGDSVEAGDMIAGVETVKQTIDLPLTSHRTADSMSLDDRQFEERLRVVAQGILQPSTGRPADHKNARFEFRALCREAIRRGEGARDSGLVEHTSGAQSLWEMALRTLGDGNLWPRIYALNADVLQDPRALLGGSSLRMPEPYSPANR